MNSSDHVGWTKAHSPATIGEKLCVHFWRLPDGGVKTGSLPLIIGENLRIDLFYRGRKYNETGYCDHNVAARADTERRAGVVAGLMSITARGLLFRVLRAAIVARIGTWKRYETENIEA